MYFNFKNLLKAYYKCRRRKRFTFSAAEFELDFEKKLLCLERELNFHAYWPCRYIRFAVSDPKLREVWAAAFRDRVVHHLLISYLEPIWEKKFIFHSYACRREKGAHLSVHYIKKSIADSSLKYYLQLDIQSFFTGINKNILFDLIEKTVKNPEILELTEIIIFHDPVKNHIAMGDKKLLNSVPLRKSLLSGPTNRGLPIGNLSSQFFANLYLNELDQFIKHKLKCRYYFRYMDDILILHSSRTRLLIWQKEISAFLALNLKLRLHPGKTILRPINSGIDFAGYLIRPDYILIRRRTVNKLKNKLWQFNRRILAKDLVHPIRLWTPELRADFTHIFASINSYYGLFKQANCLTLRRKLYEKHFGILKIYLRPADKYYSYFVWSEP